jgi:hypothetical protein
MSDPNNTSLIEFNNRTLRIRESTQTPALARNHDYITRNGGTGHPRDCGSTIRFDHRARGPLEAGRDVA